MNLPHDWIVPDWPAPARVKSLITTRNGGKSAGPYASLNLGANNGDVEHALNANREQTLAGKARNIALFLAAPFIGLAYLLAFPVVGLGIIAWIAGKAIMENEILLRAAPLLAASFITPAFVALGPIVGLGALAGIGCEALLRVYERHGQSQGEANLCSIARNPGAAQNLILGARSERTLAFVIASSSPGPHLLFSASTRTRAGPPGSAASRGAALAGTRVTGLNRRPDVGV